MIRPGDEPIPGYRVEELLGQGQFGQVWRARSPGNMSLALKFLDLTGRHGWKEFRAIQRVKQIRHAHLMPIVAIWLLDERGQVLSDDAMESIAASHEESDSLGASQQTLVAAPIGQTVKPGMQTGRPAQLIVASLLANQTLGDRLKDYQAEGRRGIPVDELLGYMDEAAKGLDFLNASRHQIGASLGAVQHCDVKPDNIMLTGGSVVICDFGVAQTLAQSRNDATATSLGGTPAYMAPECFQNKPCRTTDQYSLAVTYYELRTGKLPFTEQTYAAVYRAHLEGDLDFSAVGAAERAVLKRATATDSAQRFVSCAELVERLQEAVHPGVKQALRPSWRALAAAALAILVAAAAIGFIVFRGRNGEPPVAMARITILVEPPDAELTIDGERVALESGRATIERSVGEGLSVKASKPPERLEEVLEIENVKGDANHTLELRFSPSHLAKEANRLLEDNRFDEAVAGLAAAIKEEPDEYARLPDPLLRMTGGAAVRVLKFSPDGRWLVIGSRDGAVRRLSVNGEAIGEQSKLVHQHMDEVMELAVTDAWIASITGVAGKVMLTSTRGRTVQPSIPDEGAEIKQVAIAGQGRWLVAASEQEPFDQVRRVTSLHRWDLQSGDVDGSHKPLLPHQGEFEPLLAAAHRQPWVVLATTSVDSHIVRQCWLESTEEKVIHQQSGEVKVIAVSKDDRWIAIGGGPVSTDQELLNNRATLVDAHSQRSHVLPRGHADSISALAFDDAGNYLATGGSDGDAQAWTIPDDWDPLRPGGLEPVFLQDGKTPIESVACPRVGWVACGYEGKAGLWDGKPGAPKPLWFAQTGPRLTAMATAPDGRWIVTGHADGALRFWPAPRMMLLRRACDAAGVEPRTEEAPVDKITRGDQSLPRDRHSLSGSGGIACRPRYRPSGVLAG